jgi:hypothetical protein
VLDSADRILARADIAKLAAEFAHLERFTVEALYDHWVETHGRLPEYEEILAYFRRVTGSLHEETLWEELFGIDLRRMEPAPAPAPGPVEKPVRLRGGRPKGSRSVSRQTIVDTYRSLRASYGRPPRQAELASNLEPRIAKRTLQEHLAAYGLRWPPE